MECQYCKKSFQTKSSLTYHQKSAKYCLKIQGKDNHINKFICKICDKSFNQKQHLESHFIKCQKKVEILNYEEKIKELEKLLIEKDNIIHTLSGELNVYKLDHNTFTNIAKQPKNSNSTTTNNNKVLNISTSLDFEDKTKIKNALENYDINYFLDGQKGIARFVVDTILRDKDNNLIYLCTDPSRLSFKYMDKLGNIQKDTDAQKLRKYIIEGGLKSKIVDVSEKWIVKDNKQIDRDRFEVVVEKNNEFNKFDTDNHTFKKELACITSI
jgi:hypothetical protein